MVYHLVKPIEFVIDKPGQGNQHDQYNDYNQEIFRSWNLFFYVVFIFVHTGLFNFQLDFAKSNAISGRTLAKGVEPSPHKHLGEIYNYRKISWQRKPFQNERVLFQNEKLLSFRNMVFFHFPV